MSAGHIRRRGERSWELKFDIGTDPATGRRRIRYASFKGTKRDAEKELARLVSEAASGHGVDPSRLTVTDFLNRWERDWMVGNVSPKTAERYREIIAKHVRPRIGALLLQKLRPADLAELYSALQRDGKGEGRGLAARTVGHCHRVIHRALGHAAAWALVTRNVADMVAPPKVTEEEVAILSAGQIRALREALVGSCLHPVAGLALATGMRRGELLALRWRDIDFDRAILRVERSLETTKAGLRFKAPKTRHGRRSITLPPTIVAELRVLWREQQEQRLALGLGKAPLEALVLANWDGTPKHPDGVTKSWTRAMAAAKVASVTLHALRHTHASQLIAAGVDVLTIARRLGHGSPAITLKVYGHLFASTDDRAAQVVEAALAACTE